jgi:phytol kinase
MADWKQEIISLLALGISFIVLFVVGELLYHKLNWKGDNTRKIIHAITGFLTLLFPIYLQSYLSVGVLCGGFLLILFLSKKFKYIKSINDVDRKSQGSIIYPIIIFVLFCIYVILKPNYNFSLLFFYIPVLILAVCDPLAAAIGKRFGTHKIHYYDSKKSWEGTLAFFIGAFLITLIALQVTDYNMGKTLLLSFAVAFTSAIAELLAKDGWDNFTIPLTSLSVYFFISQYY